MEFNKQATGQLGGPSTVYQAGRHQLEQKETTTSLGTQVLSGLAKMAGDIAQRGFIDATEQEYINGQRARHLGTAFDEMESNVFTRPFARGGYQDHDYRIKQAEMTQEVQDFVAAEGKELNPEKFQEYLAEKTKALFDHVGSGMTTTARHDMVGSQMSLEQSLLQSQSKQHSEWGLQQTGKRLNAQFKGYSSRAMQAQLAGEDMQSYVEEGGVLLDSIYASLPTPLANQLAEDMFKSMYGDKLAQVATPLYNAARTSGIMQDAPIESLNKIADAQHKYLEATKFERNAQAIIKYDELEQRQAAGFPLLPEEVQGYIDAFGDTDFGTSAKAIKLMKSLDKSPALMKNARIGELWRGGHKDRYAAEGATNTQAGEYYTGNAIALAGENPGPAVIDILQHGTVMGRVPKPMTNLISEAFTAAVGSGGDMLPYDNEVMTAAFNTIRAMDADGRTQAISNILESLPEEHRLLFPAVMDNPRKTVKDAILDASAEVANANRDKMTAVQRANLDTETRAVLKEKLSANFFAERFRGWGWKSDRPMQDTIGYNQMVAEVHKEAGALAAKYTGYWSPELIGQKAYDNVLERTLVVRPEDGDAVVLNMPNIKGQQSFQQQVQAAKREDGTPVLESVNREQLADALAALYKPAGKGQQVAFDVDAIGNIYVLQQDKETKQFVTGSDTKVDPIAVANKIDEMLMQRVQATKQQQFGGVLRDIPVYKDGVPTKDKANLRIIGTNPANLRPDKVYAWREHLVKREGYAYEAYADGAGVTVGVGHQLPKGSTQGTKADAQQIDEWFLQDTTNALLSAKDFADTYGFSGDDETILAVASAVFQLGAGGVAEFEPTLQHIAEARDYAGLVERSKSWKWSTDTPKRVDDFLKAVKGRYDARK